MPEASADRFLVVRLGALGDLIHTVPAVAALRTSFPRARIDWVVECKWSPLLELVDGLDEIVSWERTFSGTARCVQRLRRARYSCALDFQGLYKSAGLAWLSGAPRRIGFDASAARESGAAWFYTERVQPSGRHVSELNLSVAVKAGVPRDAALRFPLHVPQDEVLRVRDMLATKNIFDYFVLSPGGGWKSKCWPAERYGALCSQMWNRHGITPMLNVGPREDDLAAKVIASASPAQPVVVKTSLKELAVLLQGARFVVAADTGPLHLAAALGTKVVALFGPTDPARNGPLPGGIVLRNALPSETTYKRADVYSSAMLSLSVEQVLAAAERQMGVAA